MGACRLTTTALFAALVAIVCFAASSYCAPSWDTGPSFRARVVVKRQTEAPFVADLWYDYPAQKMLYVVPSGESGLQKSHEEPAASPPRTTDAPDSPVYVEYHRFIQDAPAYAYRICGDTCNEISPGAMPSMEVLHWMPSRPPTLLRSRRCVSGPDCSVYYTRGSEDDPTTTFLEVSKGGKVLRAKTYVEGALARETVFEPHLTAVITGEFPKTPCEDPPPPRGLVDIVLAMDGSGSVDPAIYRRAGRKFAKWIRRLCGGRRVYGAFCIPAPDVRMRFALLVFGTRAAAITTFDDALEVTLAHLDDPVKMGGLSDLSGACRLAERLLDLGKAATASYYLRMERLVLITDGYATAHANMAANPVEAAMRLRDRGVRISGLPTRIEALGRIAPYLSDPLPLTLLSWKDEQFTNALLAEHADAVERAEAGLQGCESCPHLLCGCGQHDGPSTCLCAAPKDGMCLPAPPTGPDGPNISAEDIQDIEHGVVSSVAQGHIKESKGSSGIIYAIAGGLAALGILGSVAVYRFRPHEQPTPAPFAARAAQGFQENPLYTDVASHANPLYVPRD